MDDQNYEISLVNASSFGSPELGVHFDSGQESTSLALSPDDLFLYSLSENDHSIKWFSTTQSIDPLSWHGLEIWLDADYPQQCRRIFK